MAKDNISINSSAIAEIKANAVILSRQIDTTQKELQNLQKKLDGNLFTLEEYIGICFDKAVPIKRLQKQKNMMDGVVALLNRATELTESTNTDLSRLTEQLKLAINGIATSIMTSIISIVTRRNDVGDQNINIDSWSINGAKQCTEDILTAEDSSLPNVGANRIQFIDKGGQINCLWLARQKMYKILGDDTLFSDSNKLGITKLNWKKYESTGINGYSVEYREANSVKMGKLVEILQGDQPCTVMFYMNGHTFVADRIENGMVYWTDNFTPVGKQPYYKTGISTEDFNGTNYPGSYTGLLTSAKLEDFAKWYDNYSSTVNSYVVLRR